MPLQNYVDQVGPPVSAAWLNKVDQAINGALVSQGAALVPYIPPGTGALPTNIATQIGWFWTPQNFGAVGDGVHDDTAAFIALGAVINAVGYGVVISPPNKTYLIYSSVPTPTGTTFMMGISSAQGVHIDMNGSKFSVVGNFATNSATLVLLSFSSCAHVYVKDWSFVQQTQHTGTGQNGTWGVTLYNQCTDVMFVNPAGIGGQGLLFVFGATTDAPSYGSRRITGVGGYAQNQEYAIAFANSGDNVVWKGLETVGVGRSYFAYGCQNHDISLTSTNAIINDILISPGGQTGNIRPTRNIRLNYRTFPRTDGLTSPGYVYIGQGTVANNTGWVLADIDIHVDMDLSADTLINTGSAITFGKGHTTAANSYWENIRISGVVQGIPTGMANPVLNLFPAVDAPWTSEQMIGLDIHDLVLLGGGTTATVTIDVAPISNTYTGLSFRNVNAPNCSLVLLNNQGIISGLNTYFYNNQWIDRNTANLIGWTGAVSNPAIGNGTFSSLWSRTGKVVSINGTITAGTTTTFGSGAFRFNALSYLTDAFNLVPGVTYYGIAYGSHGGSKNVGIVNWIAGNLFCTITDSTTGNLWDATHPWTWASTDQLDFNITLFLS